MKEKKKENESEVRRLLCNAKTNAKKEKKEGKPLCLFGPLFIARYFGRREGTNHLDACVRRVA